ncbi:hypothetical protein RND71_022117 [Anisodus tanguticus]|uniref:FAD/NAD(P)-binding domain-containing protein n=1 Tax=Anisodus tanguticus TaxID=243964 RepID=A0AAE1V7Y1_9SOLA|nr:hypothetical protein RND71_022117 [Anisodus tanguticus]
MSLGGEKKNVVVIGGGVAGSLIAKTLQNEANVSLIDKKEYFEITWAGLRSMVEPEFAKRSVITHSEYLPHAKIISLAAVDITDTDILTKQGSRIWYDYLVVATGHTQNTASTKTEKITWLKETILKDSLDSRGRIMVDSNLRIKGHSNIFAIGDITDVPELKQGYLAQEHTKVAAKNITSLIKGVEDHHKLAVYKPATKALALVSLGRKGVAQFPCLSIVGCVPGMIKSGDLFVGKTRKGLGLQPDV